MLAWRGVAWRGVGVVFCCGVVVLLSNLPTSPDCLCVPARWWLLTGVGCVWERERGSWAAAGRFRCCLVRSAWFVRACGVWWRAFVVESVLRSLLCGVVGVPSQV